MRSIKKSLLVMVFCFAAIVVMASIGICSETITIATDNNFWFPYTYEKNEKSKGMHVDIVAKAINNLGYKAEFTPLPWKRCLAEATVGRYDAVVSASYKPERAEKFHYPKDAAKTTKSKWRITQAEYVVVTCSQDPFEFLGYLKALPRPIRVPLGYSICDDLMKKGLPIQTASSTYKLVRELIFSEKGVFITPRLNAQVLMRIPVFKNKIKINGLPIVSKSYFIIFSKAVPGFPKTLIDRIWNEIAKIRKDREFMKLLSEKYLRLEGKDIDSIYPSANP